MKITLTKRLAAGLLATCAAAQPSFAAPTDISNVPLGASAGGTFLPNLLFILDDSGSMASEYNPDYVNDPNTCLNTSAASNNNACNRGDPPFEAGGTSGFNGVGYDPNFTYLPGLTVTGAAKATFTETAVPSDTYLGTGGTVDVTKQFTDIKYCNNPTTSSPSNSNPVKICKRNGATDTTGLVATVLASGGTDAPTTLTLPSPLTLHTFAQGQLPYRTNPYNSSTVIFGLPEMMQQGIFVRSNSPTTGGGFTGTPNTTVRVTTVEVHGLVNGDAIWTNAANMGVSCATVTRLDNNNFTYVSTGNSLQARNGSWRKCSAGSFVADKNAGTVTVTSAGHGLVTNDVITTFVNGQTSMSVSNFTVTVSSTSVFTFNYSGNTDVTPGVAGFWARTGLYNNDTAVSSTAVSYSISPIEWCTDVNLTNCKEIYPLVDPNGDPNAVPPKNKPQGVDAAFSNPAFVRFCKTQADALAQGPVTGTSTPIPQTTPTATPASARCQLKFVNQTGLTTYTFPRYGWFNRDTITSGVTKYTNRKLRTDCTTAGTTPDCTYAEEIANFSKWYAFYRDRMKMMKSAAGRAFLPFISNPSGTPPKPDRLRVGFITINPTFANITNTQQKVPAVEGTKYLRIDNFNNSAPTTQAGNWYTKFYAIKPNNSTPLREALSRAGWIFAGVLGKDLTLGIPAADDPVQASCQKNYAFLTTDGFWNSGLGKDLAGADMGNQDNQNPDSRFGLNADPKKPAGMDPATNPYIPTPPATTPPPKLFVARKDATYDGALNNSVSNNNTTPGGSGTLADVAMYYYRNDLRGGKDLAGNDTGPATSPSAPLVAGLPGDVSTNNVPPSTNFDFATHQHMNTFTIGLADGLMRYTSDYTTNSASDYSHIANADTGFCFWNGAGTCNWPVPVFDGQSALDDLWHAAVNGRGTFYSATNPIALANGLSSALNNLDLNVASASAAATSSPQVATGQSLAFSTTYQTATWSGEIFAQHILANGEIDETSKIWEGEKDLLLRIPTVAKPVPDKPLRVLWTYDVSRQTSNKLKPFAVASAGIPLSGLDATTELPLFASHCAPSVPPAAPIPQFSHCSSLTGLQLKTANDPSKLIAFLQGIATDEGGAFRDRSEQDQATGKFVQTVLGDIVNSQPVTVGAPFFNYENELATHGYPVTPVPYSEPTNPKSTRFKEAKAPRAPAVLVGSNDGFLHSFAQADGSENWAYAPRFLLGNMYQLADKNYPGQHRFFVDGSPEIADVFDVNDGAQGSWKTIVVGGLNSGGKGFYALDITNPTGPIGLWEFCNDPSLCPDSGGNVHSDKDLGFSYGNPVIGRMDRTGNWVVVVTSGLNNTGTNSANQTGDGKGYFYILDAITGKILHKVLADDGSGSVTSPSGLMKIGAYYGIGQDDPNFSHVYGGDQNGNVWRMDVSKFPATQKSPADILPYPTITNDSKIVAKLAILKDNSGRPQPITARPAGTHLGKDPFAPDTRIYYVGTGRYIGTSDLTDPGTGSAWQQTLYGIRDQLDNGVAWVGASGFAPQSLGFRKGLDGLGPQPKGAFVVEQVLSPVGLDRSITKNPIDWTKQDGFFIDLNPTFKGDPPAGNSPGERVFQDVRLIFGTLVYTSNVPAAGGACTAGGNTFQYTLDFRTGGYVGNDSTAVAGSFIKEFVVGSAVVQTGPGEYKLLNKTIKGKPLTANLPVDTAYQGQRFSYRER